MALPWRLDDVDHAHLHAHESNAPHGGRYDDILDAIGHTPLVEIPLMSPNPDVRIYAKLEMLNPTGSVKDRVAKYLIEDLERRGLLQTNEALKVLLGIGHTLAGRLVLFDALETEFTELQLRRDPNCPACGDEATEARKAGRPLNLANVGQDAPFLLTTTGLAGTVSPDARA